MGSGELAAGRDGRSSDSEILAAREDFPGLQYRENKAFREASVRSLNGDYLMGTPAPVRLCTTTLQNPRVPRGFFPERGGVRGTPAAAGCPQGTPQTPTGAGEVSGPLRLVLGGHSRAPWVAAPPLCVQRASWSIRPGATSVTAEKPLLRGKDDAGIAHRPVIYRSMLNPKTNRKPCDDVDPMPDYENVLAD